MRSEIFSRPGIVLHFIWRSDYQSVARYGLLSHYLRYKTMNAKERPYKAQRQIGTDLISIWDPWSFLRRHWRNRPLGSENEPWEIFRLDLTELFAREKDHRIARSLFDPDESIWLGQNLFNSSVLRHFDYVRRRMSDSVRIEEAAPGLKENDMPCVMKELVEQLVTRNSSSQEEMCLLIDPSIQRYDFPGYKA